MLHSARDGWQPRPARRAMASFRGPSHFARQIDAALRVAPVAPFRRQAAVLLGCQGTDLLRAEVALRERWPLDAVHAVELPMRSWRQALQDEPGTASWLRRYALREIERRDPSLVAILAGASPQGHAGQDDAQALVARLRSWGVAAPVAALRLGTRVEWLVAPEVVEGSA